MAWRRPVIYMVSLGQVVQRLGLLTSGSESFSFHPNAGKAKAALM